MRPSLILLAVTALSAPAADWPQWLGPTRDATWAETGILRKFPAGGPKKLWSVAVGGGYSSPSVAGGKVFLTDYVKAEGEAFNNPGKRAKLAGSERVTAFDESTGNQLWQYSHPENYSISYPAGPRAAPTVADGRVYAVGAMGHLVALDAATGKLVWEKNYTADYKIEPPIWGFAGHPLVYQNLLICTVGGDGSVVVAFDRATGKEVWRALSAPEPGYSAPTVVHAGGVDQLLIWHAKAVNSLDPLTGETHWKLPLEPSYGMAIMMPRVEGDTLFAGGIGNVAVAVKLDAGKPALGAELYRGGRSVAVYPVNMTPVVRDGVVYAVDQPGQLRAVELATGKRLWETFRPILGEDKEPEYKLNSGTAHLAQNGDATFLFTERGELVVAELTPAAYTELDRAKLVEPTGEAFGRKVAWAAPAYADKKIFVRTDAELACFSLAQE